jgi:Uma2 family endonuclease
MPSAGFAPPQVLTLGDLVDRLGPIPFSRIRSHPSPGTASEDDLLAAIETDDCLCELVDGTLVEKVMGYREAQLQFRLSFLLGKYWESQKKGEFAGADGPVQLRPGLVRLPDLSFVASDRVKSTKRRGKRIFPAAPDLAVEIISEGNTSVEMRRKLAEYFQHGVKEVWYLYPATRELYVYHSLKRRKIVAWPGVFKGSQVLPGFELSLLELFEGFEEE